MTELTQSKLEQDTPLPTEVVPVEKIPRWLDQTRLQEDPFDSFITTKSDEKEEFFGSEMKDRHDSIMASHDRLKKEIPEATTEAQWRRNVWHILRRIKTTMAEWQLWHQLWLCAKNGWLGGPLWDLRTARQGDNLASLMADEKPLSDRTLDGPGQPSEKDFKTMGVKSNLDWKKLTGQIEGSLTVDRCVVDAGRVPLPHQENTHSDNATVRKYLYRTGRLGEDTPSSTSESAPLMDDANVSDQPDDTDTDDVQESSVRADGDGDDPESEDSEELESVRQGEEKDSRSSDASGDVAHDPMELDESDSGSSVPEVRVDRDVAKSYATELRMSIAAEFEDVRAVEMDEFAEVAWENGFPNPWDQFGEFVEKSGGVHRYENNRGEQQDSRKECYVLDLHSGMIWLVPGVEGFGVWKTVVDFYEDKDADISSALAWMQLDKNTVLEAQSRHQRLEYLLKRAGRAGMHNVHELYVDEQEGAGPPPSSERLDNLEERIINFEEAEDKEDEDTPLSVECPHCHVDPGEECMSSSGKPMDADNGHWHIEREQFLNGNVPSIEGTMDASTEASKEYERATQDDLGGMDQERWEDFLSCCEGSFEGKVSASKIAFLSGKKFFLHERRYSDDFEEVQIHAYELVPADRWERIPFSQIETFNEECDKAGESIYARGQKVGDHHEYRIVGEVLLAFPESEDADAGVPA